MTSELKDSVLLINSSDPDNNRFGTGFVIYQENYKTYVVTCAHVIRDIGGVHQAMAGGHPAKVIAYGEEEGTEDLAVLEIEAKIAIPLEIETFVQIGDNLIVTGFQSFNKQYLVRNIRGHLGEQVGLEVRGQYNPTKAWDLEIIGDYHLQPGYSGAPVIDVETGKVFAVTSHRQGEGERGIAISIEALEKIWPAMPIKESESSYIITSANKKNNSIAEIVMGYVSDYFFVFIETLYHPISMFAPVNIDSNVNIKILKSKKIPVGNTRINPHLFIFIFISISIGYAINRYIPGYENPSDPIATFIMITCFWFLYSFSIHFFCKAIGGRGALLQTLTIGLQLFGISYSLSSLLAIIWAALSKVSIITLAITTLFGSLSQYIMPVVEEPILMFFIIDFFFLSIYFPVAIKYVHKFGWFRQLVVGSIAPITIIYLNLGIFSITKIPVGPIVTPTPKLPTPFPTVQVTPFPTPGATPTVQQIVEEAGYKFALQECKRSGSNAICYFLITRTNYDSQLRFIDSYIRVLAGLGNENKIGYTYGKVETTGYIDGKSELLKLSVRIEDISPQIRFISSLWLDCLFYTDHSHFRDVIQFRNIPLSQ